jgi:archaellum biogenesis ATPase FlaH
MDIFELKLRELEEIEKAPDPEFLIGSLEKGNPFPIPKNGITLITAKSGGGKSTLSRAILQKFLDDPNTAIVYADYNFDEFIARERRFSDFKKLLDEERFLLLTQLEEEEIIKEFIKTKSYRRYLDPKALEEFETALRKIEKAKLSERQKIFLYTIYFQSYRSKNVIAVVDNLEDIIIGSSEKKLKRFTDFILKRPNITVIFNHRVRKAINDILDIGERASWFAIKSKATLFIEKMEMEGDFIKCDIKVIKMKHKYLRGVDRVFVRIDTRNYEIGYSF